MQDNQDTHQIERQGLHCQPARVYRCLVNKVSAAHLASTKSVQDTFLLCTQVTLRMQGLI